MAKVTVQELKDLGFIAELFGNPQNFDAYLTAVIAEQASILEGRIGASAYASTSSPIKDYVKRAEKCLAAAELVQRRITYILGNVTGGAFPISTSGEDRQRQAYIDEAAVWITKIVEGAETDSNDFASGSLVTNHFGV